MGKQKRIRKNRRARNPQIDPELQLLHDHRVLAQVKEAEKLKEKHDNSGSS
jgi:hypothetical protein